MPAAETRSTSETCSPASPPGTERTTRLEREDKVSMAEFGTATDLYFGGDMEASIALSGQVAGYPRFHWLQASFT